MIELNPSLDLVTKRNLDIAISELISQNQLYKTLFLDIYYNIADNLDSPFNLVIRNNNLEVDADLKLLSKYSKDEMKALYFAEVIGGFYRLPEISTRYLDVSDIKSRAAIQATFEIMHYEFLTDEAKNENFIVFPKMFSYRRLQELLDVPVKRRETFEYYYNLCYSAELPERFRGESSHIYNSTDGREIFNKVTNLIVDNKEELKAIDKKFINSNVQKALNNYVSLSKYKWKEILVTLSGQELIGFKHSFYRPNRRWEDRLDIPGNMPEYIPNIIIMQDVSSSVSDKDTELFFNELYSLNSISESDVRIFQFTDRVIESDCTRTRRSEGKTSFTSAINYVNSLNDSKDSVVIIFTDGYGEETIPLINVKNVIWIVTKELSVTNPQGLVLPLKEPLVIKQH